MTCFLPTPQVLDLLYFAMPARRGLAATTCDLFFHPADARGNRTALGLKLLARRVWRRPTNLDSRPPPRAARRPPARRGKERPHVHQAALSTEIVCKLAGAK